jgi:hypothetical protein
MAVNQNLMSWLTERRIEYDLSRWVFHLVEISYKLSVDRQVDRKPRLVSGIEGNSKK